MVLEGATLRTGRSIENRVNPLDDEWHMVSGDMASVIMYCFPVLCCAELVRRRSPHHTSAAANDVVGVRYGTEVRVAMR
jgi:hypothetical protein